MPVIPLSAPAVETSKALESSWNVPLPLPMDTVPELAASVFILTAPVAPLVSASVVAPVVLPMVMVLALALVPRFIAPVPPESIVRALPEAEFRVIVLFDVSVVAPVPVTSPVSVID